MSKRSDFIAAIAPKAQELQAKYGIPASIIIAQAIVESASGDAAIGNNIFGIKATSSWTGPTMEVATHEYINGQRVATTAKFRAYGSIAESMDDHAALLARRYSSVIGTDGRTAALLLQSGGYATSPDYATTLQGVIASNDLARFDDPRFKGYDQDPEKYAALQRRLAQQGWNQPETRPDDWKELDAQAKVLMMIFSGIMQALLQPQPQPPAATLSSFEFTPSPVPQQPLMQTASLDTTRRS